MLYAAVRGVIFAALLLLIGSQVAAALVQAQLRADPELAFPLFVRLRRMLWPVVALLIVAVLAKGMLQLLSFRDPGERVTYDLVQAVLLTGGWGRSWLLQLCVAVLLLATLRWERQIVTHGVLAALIIWFQTGMGHAAGAHWPEPLGRAVDAAHLIGLGFWLGTLAALAIAAFPSLHGEGRLPALAAVVRGFSFYARIGVALVMASGVTAALVYLGPVMTIAQSAWGRLLLIKLVCMTGVMALGWYNWRIVTPALEGHHATARQRLRGAIRLELLLGLAMLIITAMLVASPLPGEG